jgi:hypothetical protein
MNLIGAQTSTPEISTFLPEISDFVTLNGINVFYNSTSGRQLGNDTHYFTSIG